VGGWWQGGRGTGVAGVWGMSRPRNYMHRLGWVGAVAGVLRISGCDLLAGPEEVELAPALPATASATMASMDWVAGKIGPIHRACGGCRGVGGGALRGQSVLCATPAIALRVRSYVAVLALERRSVNGRLDGKGLGRWGLVGFWSGIQVREQPQSCKTTRG